MSNAKRSFKKAFNGSEGLVENGPIPVVVLGEGVTHRALWFDEIDYDTVYYRLLAQKISARRSYVPVNVINAAVGGTAAKP